MNEVDKIEKLLEELTKEVKNAQGAIMAMAIVHAPTKKAPYWDAHTATLGE